MSTPAGKRSSFSENLHRREADVDRVAEVAYARGWRTKGFNWCVHGRIVMLAEGQTFSWGF